MPLGPQNIDLKESRRRLAAGGLPLRASLRLKEEAGPDKKLFTSDLTVNEFLLARETDCQIVSQVMGSSIYHIGRIADYKGSQGGKSSYEIPKLSEAHREARWQAIHRLQLEAKAVAADAVVGIRLGERLITKGAHGKGGDDGDEVIEFTVVGTAVRAPSIKISQEPVLTDLSGQDFWALVRQGYAPCGIAFDFCRWHVWHVLSNWSPGGEVTAATNAIEQARQLVEDHIRGQARQMGAEFVVGSDLKIEVHEVPCGYHECHLNDLDVDVSWFGTGIRRLPVTVRPEHAQVPPLVLGMMPLGRKKHRDVIEEEDESEELKREAKEEEERAARSE
jgi:uncharacterized protein YbjQ (UPF0145 family)